MAEVSDPFYGHDYVPIGALVYTTHDDNWIQGRVIKTNETTLCVVIQRADGLILNDIYTGDNNPNFKFKGEYDMDGNTIPPNEKALHYLKPQDECKLCDDGAPLLLGYDPLYHNTTPIGSSAPTVTNYKYSSTFIPIEKCGLCDICKKETEFRCLVCMRTFYCSRKCQKQGWTEDHATSCSQLKSGYGKSTTTTYSANNSNVKVVDCSYNVIQNNDVELTPGSARVGKRTYNNNNSNYYNNPIDTVNDMNLNANKFDIEEGNGPRLTAEALAEHSKCNEIFKRRIYKEANNYSSEEGEDDDCDNIYGNQKVYPEHGGVSKKSQSDSKVYGPPVPPNYPIYPIAHPVSTDPLTVDTGVDPYVCGPVAAANVYKSNEPEDLDSMISELEEILAFSKTKDEIKEALRKANWNKDTAMCTLFD